MGNEGGGGLAKETSVTCASSKDLLYRTTRHAKRAIRSRGITLRFVKNRTFHHHHCDRMDYEAAMMTDMF